MKVVYFVALTSCALVWPRRQLLCAGNPRPRYRRADGGRGLGSVLQSVHAGRREPAPLCRDPAALGVTCRAAGGWPGGMCPLGARRATACSKVSARWAAAEDAQQEACDTTKTRRVERQKGRRTEGMGLRAPGRAFLRRRRALHSVDAEAAFHPARPHLLPAADSEPPPQTA
jgi:hypothetical protein